MGSHQTLVDYMTPLGLAHIMGDDQHYGPGPWLNSFGDHPEWNPVYYHKADAQGLGFNRTATGSNAVGQYASAVGSVFATRATIPDDFLLFFHHVGWSETLASGRTLWAELVHRYSAGVDGVQTMRDTWSPLSNRIDSQRFGEVTDFLSRSSTMRRAGGVTPASLTSHRSRSSRSRRAMPRSATRWTITRTWKRPARPTSTSRAATQFIRGLRRQPCFRERGEPSGAS